MLRHHCPGFASMMGETVDQLSHAHFQVLSSNRLKEFFTHHQDGWMDGFITTKQPPSAKFLVRLARTAIQLTRTAIQLMHRQARLQVISVGKPGSNNKLPKMTTTFTTAFSTSLLQAAQNIWSPSHSHQLSAPAPAPSAETPSKTHCIITAPVFFAL